MKTKLFMTVLSLGWCCLCNAQTYEWQKPIKHGEKVLMTITDTIDAGQLMTRTNGSDRDSRKNYSVEELYNHMLEKMEIELGKINYILRQFEWKSDEKMTHSYETSAYMYVYYRKYYYTSAIVVIPENPVSNAIDKALIGIEKGTRIAINRVSVPNGFSMEEIKDQMIEVLLDKGIKVVDKEYLDKLYEEIQSQHRDFYNDSIENSSSTVGYYLNINLTETTLRVQIINISNGEYVGNASVKL